MTQGSEITGDTWSTIVTIGQLGNNYGDKTIEIVAYDAQNNSSLRVFTLIGDKGGVSIGDVLDEPDDGKLWV